MNGQIEREYRDALDGLRFSDEGKERMMKNLMEQKGQDHVTWRGFRPLRAGLAAAALCAALLGTAAAAQFLGIHIEWQVEHPLASGSNYSVKGGVSCFPADSFPQEIQDMAKQDSLTGKNFRSWAELEEFLGRDLPDSTALESARPGPRAIVSGSKGRGSHILLRVSAFEEGIVHIGAEGHYVLDGIEIQQSAQIYTDKAEENFKMYGPDGEEYAPGSVMIYEDGSEVTEETYTTPSGLTAAIVGITPPDGSREFVTEYNAHFSINGIQYTVSAETYTVGYTRATVPEDPAHTLEVLKTVLDGFQ